MKTGKQLGLNNGAKITKATKNNIVMCAIMHKMGDDILKLIVEEAKIVNMIGTAVNPADKLEKLVATVSDYSGRTSKVYESLDITFVNLNGEEIRIGFDQFVSRYHIDTTVGIISTDIGKNIVKNTTKDELAKLTFMPSGDVINEKWDPELHIRKITGFNSPTKQYLHVRTTVVYSRLNPIEKTKVTNFMKKLEKITTRIANVKLMTKQLIAVHGTPVRLCNNVPEFVEIINDSMAYNADGKKCTDVLVHDIAAEFSKA